MHRSKRLVKAILEGFFIFIIMSIFLSDKDREERKIYYHVYMQSKILYINFVAQFKLLFLSNNLSVILFFVYFQTFQ